MNIKQIKSVLKSSAGKELRHYLIQEVTQIRDLSNLKIIDDPVAMAVEIKARKQAQLILENILSQLSIWENDENQGRSDKDNFYIV